MVNVITCSSQLHTDLRSQHHDTTLQRVQSGITNQSLRVQGKVSDPFFSFLRLSSSDSSDCSRTAPAWRRLSHRGNRSGAEPRLGGHVPVFLRIDWKNSKLWLLEARSVLPHVHTCSLRCARPARASPTVCWVVSSRVISQSITFDTMRSTLVEATMCL